MPDATEIVTLNDVWKAFLETDRRMREADRLMQERMQEQRQEHDRRMQEHDRRMQERMQEHDRRIQENDRQMQETRRMIREMSAETDKEIKAVNKQIGQLGGRLGEFVEEMIKPTCIAMFQARGIPVDEIFSRAKKKVGGETMEIDLLLANTVAAVLIEVKSHLTAEDVQHHLKKLPRFKSFFPRFADCRIYGAVAGMVIASEADRFAMHQGLFVIAQNGENVGLANEPDFVPRHW
ncbi:MAG: hypothetical protein H7833_14905 [Magnetococcus sp. DMHC-1]|nr:hypothetical protein [Magnetococcales bacterium]